MDDTCRVTAVTDGWLYAVGDVNRRALTTHQGKYQARIAGAAIAARAAGTPLDDGRWGVHAATADHTAVPQVVFTTPEVASVGLTAHEAIGRSTVRQAGRPPPLPVLVAPSRGPPVFGAGMTSPFRW